MLPHDVTRCAGHAPHATGLCPRKNECARYLAPAGAWTPFVLSACEAGFIHAKTVAEAAPADHPQTESRRGVLEGNTVRAGGGLA